MTGPGVVDLGRFLRGAWRIERDILAAGRPAGRFTGSGRFEPDAEIAGRLRYVEHGTLQLGDHTGPASRDLGYVVSGPTAQVVFDDGRPFHDLDLRTGVHEVEHPCRADRYHGRFEVLSLDRWRHTWTVIGPAKDHRIVTVLRRA